MRVRGEKQIDAKTFIESKLRIEFSIKQGMEIFEIRSALLKILNRLSLTDPKMYMKDGYKTRKGDKEFPSGDKFEQIFSISQMDPPQGKLMMVVYVNIVSSKNLCHFKDQPQVIKHIKENDIFIKIDQFECKKVASCIPAPPPGPHLPVPPTDIHSI
eukprot:9497165-Ditylum_brightwellii.AAC.1